MQVFKKISDLIAERESLPKILTARKNTVLAVKEEVTRFRAQRVARLRAKKRKDGRLPQKE